MIFSTFTGSRPVEMAIQESLETGQPALLLTDCAESFASFTGHLAGCCDTQGPEARDGTLRFYGSDDAGRPWDVRLRCQRATRPNGHTPDEAAQLELRHAMQTYMLERTTQAATAVAVALVNADQARADSVDTGSSVPPGPAVL